MFNTAVVNSSSFGKIFPEHWKALTRLGKVKRVQVPIGIKGKDLARQVRGFQAVIASVNPDFTADFFKETQGTLKLLARHGIGTNNVDLKAAAQAGVIVTKVQGIKEREAMAEHSIALLLSALRKIHGAQEAVRLGHWGDRHLFVGSEIRGRVLGIVGLGNIGRRVADIARKGFGAKVLAYDPRLKASEIKKRGAQPASLKSILKTADFISLHCGLTSKNYHFINRAALRLVKPGLTLVNTARGELVDQKALLEALRSGRLGSYACDVVEGEPITRRNHPLFRNPKVIVVPHIGAYTQESLWAMGEKVVQDVLDVARGKKPKEMVKPKA